MKIGLLAVPANVLALLFTITAIFPIVWMVYTSLKTNPEFSLSLFALPSQPTLSNYENAFRVGNLSSALFSSVFNTVLTIPLIVLGSFILGYFFARYNFRGKTTIRFVLLVGMLIPIHSLLVPLFLQFKWFGMLDTRFTLIIPYVAFNLSLTTFLFQSFIRDIPTEIEEAAYIDGSTTDYALFRIIFPICLPMVSTAVILNVLHTWNELPFAFILNRSAELFTLPIWLTYFSGQYTTDYTGKIAGLVITSLPIVILYLFFSNKIMNGMSAGAVKG
ncbi:carbohydrate ABC transporter permease [Cohnella terricola]|uniref:Carbohydrate ABC transporter permease n=2 Tax=Cohnella terricola TaxID=1289167 RepID=A0A559JC41_9BACL|nr:carbohydrate ABC transporter permease [Cohnella terricola]